MNFISVHRPIDAKYDVLKFILSLSVVAIHSQVYPQVLYPWLRLSVPLFFIMTSYFLFSKLKNAPAEKQKEILRNFLLRNLRLYCFWFIILLPITLFGRWRWYFSDGLVLGLYKCCRDLLFGSSFFASWYIKASVVGVFLIFFLSKKLKQRFVLIFSLLVFAFVTLRSSYTFVCDRISILSKLSHMSDLLLGTPVLSFPAAIVWVFVGKCFAEGRIKFPSPLAAAAGSILSCIGLYAEWRFVVSVTAIPSCDSYFMLLPLCVCLFGCIQSIKPITLRHSLVFRQASTIIYAVHGSVILAIKQFFSVSSPLLLFAVTVAVCIAVFLGIEYLLRRFSSGKLSGILKWAY